MAVDVLLAANWLIVKDWSEESRYERWTVAEATALIDAIREPNHGGAAMGQGALVEMQIDAGKALVESLRNTGFDVTVTGWTQSSEEGDWYLYIASKDVDDRGLAEAYRTVYTTIKGNPEFGIDPFDVKLIGRENPIAKDLLQIRGAGVARIATRSRRPKLGHMSVEETYVYAP